MYRSLSVCANGMYQSASDRGLESASHCAVWKISTFHFAVTRLRPLKSVCVTQRDPLRRVKQGAVSIGLLFKGSSTPDHTQLVQRKKEEG